MPVINTVLGWAKSAWGLITGGAGQVGSALLAIWHYSTSIHSLLSYLMSKPVLDFMKNAVTQWSIFGVTLNIIHDVLLRVSWWIWWRMIVPVRNQLQGMISRDHAWTVRQFWATDMWVIRLYLAGRAYALALTAAERAARARAVAAEHAAMVKAVAAALAAVQHEAASGYNSGYRARLGPVQTLLDDLAVRNPVVKTLVTDLVKAAIDLEGIDNPVARFLVARLLTEVIDKAGVDKVTGQLAARFLEPLTGAAQPANLYDVCRDIGARLTAIEQWIADFNTHGGPEIEDAGDQWKAITGLGVDAAVLAMFGTAVADPGAFATGAADTVGTAANAALGSIVTLIGKA